MIRLERRGNEDSNELSLTVQPNGKPAEAYACRARCCDDPFCHCSALLLEVCPESPAARDRWPDTPGFDIGLDPLERTDGYGCVPPQRGEHVAFGRFVAAALREEHWETLCEVLRLEKQRVIDGLDPDRAVIDMPFDSVERFGTMIRYYGVLPFAPPIVWRADDGEYFADDQYCPGSGCTCTTVALTLCRIDPPLAQGDRCVWVDYERRSWRDGRTQRKPTGKMRRLCRALARARPDLMDILRRRHDFMRRLYRSSREALCVPYPAVTVFGRPRASIDAPCPCGSGLSHDACCGWLDVVRP